MSYQLKFKVLFAYNLDMKSFLFFTLKDCLPYKLDIYILDYTIILKLIEQTMKYNK